MQVCGSALWGGSGGKRGGRRQATVGSPGNAMDGPALVSGTGMRTAQALVLRRAGNVVQSVRAVRQHMTGEN